MKWKEGMDPTGIKKIKTKGLDVFLLLKKKFNWGGLQGHSLEQIH